MSTLVKVSVFYRSGQTSIIETAVQVGPLTLIANFGGALGLWLGASVISIVQLGYYAVRATVSGVREMSG